MTPTLLLTADPAFADLALRELLTAVPTANVGQALSADIYPIDLNTPFAELVARWRAASPIFVRHMCPVQAVYPPLTGEGDMAALATAVVRDFAARLDPARSFSVQTRLLGAAALKPFAVNKALSTVLQAKTDARLDVRDPAQIVSVVAADTAVYVGLSAAANNLSNWPGGAHRLRREKNQISRAAFKLLEALSVFGVDLPAQGQALDLGAAPGGWTQVLRKQGLGVTAVDPADLDPRLRRDKHVDHVPITAEAYLQKAPPVFDVIVNDMRLDVRDSARLVVAFAPHLRTGGVAIMTFKLPERGRRRAVESGLAILEHAYTIAGARQLFHNRSEITVCLRRPQGFQ